MSGYVLIVESDLALQKRINDALKEARYELASEAEGTWAKRSIAVRTPDAIIVDTSLTDGDGFSLAESIRSDPDTRDTPLFFIATRFRGASHRAEARRRFAPAEYLTSPLDVNSLLAMVLQTVPPSGAGAGAEPPPGDDAGRGLPKAEISRPAPGPAQVPESIKEVALKDPAAQRERRDVERSAKSLAAEKAELHGTLKRMPFGRLVQRLYARRVTGSLLLLRDSTKKIVSFVEGYPVSVRSNLLNECLGQILLGQRLITSQALAESVRRMKDESRHQGEILVEMGVLSPYNLSRALVEQMEAKLFEIFAWRDGQFMLKECDAPPKETVRLERPPAALILEGIRRHYDSARQRAVLDSFVGHYVTLSPDPVMRLQEMTSDPTELEFIRSIDGSARFEAVLEAARIPRDKARLLLVALSEAGMIAPADTAVRRPRAVPASASTPPAGSPSPFPAALPTAEADPSDTMDDARPLPAGVVPLSSGQLSMVAETVRTQNYFWALGVEPDATTAAIDKAYETVARSFHSDRYRNSPDEDRRLAKEIFERLAEAHRVLRDPAKRKSYAARMERKSEKKPELTRSGSFPNGAAKALYDAGMEHLRARRHHEAVDVFRQAARLVPGEADFRAALGWALFREAPADARAGRAALAELRRALQIDGNNRRALQYLAQFHAQTGQPELAIQELEKILELDPTAADVADELRRLRERN
jgi:DNA-binding response OmpR family regulator/Flp pilus assembly protein TadD